MNDIKIGMVDSPNYEGVKYNVGLSNGGLVYIEIESLDATWSQVGKNIDMDSPNKISDALGRATEYLKINENAQSFKQYKQRQN